MKNATFLSYLLLISSISNFGISPFTFEYLKLNMSKLSERRYLLILTSHILGLFGLVFVT